MPKRKKPDVPELVQRHVNAVLLSENWKQLAPLALSLCSGCPGRSDRAGLDYICSECPLVGIAYAVALADRQRVKLEQEENNGRAHHGKGSTG